MARAAYVMDNFMHMMGLHGKSFLPIFLGFGCNVPAVMGTRVIDSWPARLLTILIAPLVPCTARMAVLAFLAPAFFGAQGRLGLLGPDPALPGPARPLRHRCSTACSSRASAPLLSWNFRSTISPTPAPSASWSGSARFPSSKKPARPSWPCRCVHLAALHPARRRPADQLPGPPRPPGRTSRALDGPGLAADPSPSSPASWPKKMRSPPWACSLATPEPAWPTLAAALTAPTALAFLTVSILFIPCAATVAVTQETGSWRWTLLIPEA